MTAPATKTPPSPTPRPWTVNRDVPGFSGPRIESRDEHGIVNEGWIIAEFAGPDAEANAAFAVLAANEHEALVEALRLFVEEVDDPIRQVENLSGLRGVWLSEQVKAQARAILSRIEGASRG
jgi:hypothetical protein